MAEARRPPVRSVLASTGWVLVAFGTVLGVGAFVVFSANSNESSGGAEALTIVAALAIPIGAAILFLGTALILVSVVTSLVARSRARRAKPTGTHSHTDAATS